MTNQPVTRSGRMIDRTEQNVNVPNTITVLRLVVFTPLVTVLLAQPDTRLAATIALVLFGATDWIDGALARGLGQTTRLGQVLDPIADRFGVAWICVAMLIFSILPWWVPVTIIAVDAVVLVVGIGRTERIDQMRVLPVGKIRTALLMAGLPLAALGASTIGQAPTVAVIAHAVLVAGSVLHVIAGVLYLYALLRPMPRVSDPEHESVSR
ncbi:MAG: CDP-alcohol phosphatidyltransferase family protein [Propionibacteriales bacterium]|nr:CDP-alcohol phosphatidyltransferase family protein [Propionibacteriales bacterium]